MVVKFLDGNIILEYVKNFDLDQTFGCGQCFLFEKIKNNFIGTANNKDIRISQQGNQIKIYDTTEKEFKELWFDFFDLGTDYSKIGDELSYLHPILKEAYINCSGIRILKQEPWETLCSFIISQNNNIPRIKKIIKALCELYGEKTKCGFSFPTAKKISSMNLDDLSPIKSGFRAKYILDAAKKISNGDINLEEIKSKEYFYAKDLLMNIHGVGPKVADCVLLYGFHRLEAFPLDVWMKKIMNKFFADKSSDFFGKFAGIAQQYLYHFTRQNPDILN